MHEENATGCGHADICDGGNVLLRGSLVRADSLEAEQNGEAQCGQQTAAGLLLRKVFKYVIPFNQRNENLVMFKKILLRFGKVLKTLQQTWFSVFWKPFSCSNCTEEGKMEDV